MVITEVFGNRVKELRQKLNISQEELSFRSELHRTYISSIESGKRNVSLVNIEKLANALECDISDFFNFKNINHGRK
jgi:transcriptional regulator with XRE-family HTH domain